MEVLEGEYYLCCIKPGMVFAVAHTGNKKKKVRDLYGPGYFTSEAGCKEAINICTQTINEVTEVISGLYLNLPIRLKCENISPPGTYSITMYKLELS